MTRINVPPRPPLPSRAEVLSGRPVRGRTWSSTAELYNWVLANGVTLVPFHTPQLSWSGAGAKTLSFRVHPRKYALARVWALQLTDGTWQIAAPSGGSVLLTQRVWSAGTSSPPFLVTESIPAPTKAMSTITLEITASGAGTLRSVGCYEIPRAVLENGTTATANTERGVLSESMTPQEQIFYDIDARANSFGGLGETAWKVEEEVNRGTLFSWTSEGDANAIQVTGAGPVTLFDSPPILLGPKVRRDATTVEVIPRIAVRCSTADTEGTVTFTMASGDAVTITIPASFTSYDWLPVAAAPLDIHAEDVTTADGRRAATWDTCTITAGRTAGAGTIYIRNIAIGHPVA